MAAAAGKLKVLNPVLSFTQTYTLLGGLIGGALLSAASHGTDQLIVQRLLATRSLRDAQVAVVGSGVAVILQFCLFLMIGSAIWAAGLAPEGMPADQIFSRFILEQLPTGLAGLMVAGILAAAMSTISSSINALASSVTHDLYASWTGVTDPVRLLKLGRVFSALWGVALIGAALLFHRICAAAATRRWWSWRSPSRRSPTARCSAPTSWPARVARARGRDVVGRRAAVGGGDAGRRLRRAARRPARRSAGSPRWAAWPGRGTCRSAPG